jgi:hypothetical protein
VTARHASRAYRLTSPGTRGGVQGKFTNVIAGLAPAINPPAASHRKSKELTAGRPAATGKRRLCPIRFPNLDTAA